MGHLHDADTCYRKLQERFSRNVQGNPPSETLLKILRILFSPEEAEFARKLPHSLTPVDTIAKSLGIPQDELRDKVTDLARRGVVFDMEHQGRRYVTLPPVVIGFFEFVFMRHRPDLPMRELALLFEQYFRENDGALARSFWEGQTQIARAFVREESLSPESSSEVLDWERATQVLTSASAVSVGLCQCQQTARHHGKGCDKPAEVCLSFNYAAESLARNGNARPITRREAMRILERSKDARLAQIGDNVQRNVSFICNCCGCCCHMLRGMKAFTGGRGVVTSNWFPRIDPSACKGCGECARACPMDAIRMEIAPENDRKERKLAVADAALCLGCGVCRTVCKTTAMAMVSRPSRVLVPETVFEQRVAMAIERGKLAVLLFDDPGSLSHRALSRVVAALERSSPFRAAMAADSLKSAFLKTMVAGAKRKTGELSERFS